MSMTTPCTCGMTAHAYDCPARPANVVILPAPGVSPSPDYQSGSVSPAPLPPCGHPWATTVYSPEGTAHCRWCEEVGRLAAERNAADRKWMHYEREFILPCFLWAEEESFDLKAAVLANAGRNCVDLLVQYLRAARDEALRRLSVAEEIVAAYDDAQKAANAAGFGPGTATDAIRCFDAEREAAEARERAALVAGAVLIARAREALQRIHALRIADDGEPCKCGECSQCVATAALRALDGGGDVREWAYRLAAQGGDVLVKLNVVNEPDPGGVLKRGYRAVLDAALASPPALPNAEAALAEAFAFVMDWIGYEPQSGTAMSLARRWLPGERMGR